MTQRRVRPDVVGALVLTMLLVCARVWPAAALHDPVSGVAPPELYLKIPGMYLILAPLFTLWDGVSMLSMTRLIGFLSGVLVLYLAWRLYAGWVRSRQRNPGGTRRFPLRELGVLLLSTALFAGFVVIGALWHRPMLSLEGSSPGELVVDFHSHTNVSHDVRNTWMRGFDREANRRWHSRAGFDAAFITDHNLVSRESPGAGRQAPAARRQSPVISRQSPVASRQAPVSTGQTGRASTVLCPGTEVSAWRAHVVLLGDTMPVDRSRYRGLDGLLALLGTSNSTYGALSLASLPEYRRNHWERLDQLASSGLDGFEIVNASPKANELTRAEIDTVVSVARRHDLFVVGVSDSHGWGATSMVWNLVPTVANSPADKCTAITRQLQSGFGAVRIVERHRVRPDDWWPMWLTPLAVVWETWRSMGWLLTLAWLAWIWGWIGVRLAVRFRPEQRKLLGQTSLKG